MQGERVVPEVRKAIEKLVAHGCDLIVITRGGGSAADLRWFDASEIAYAIVECPTPVICAIGHHDDVCVAEEVSYMRQKTPTAAAEYILAIFSQTRDKIDSLARKLAALLAEKAAELAELQSALSERLDHMARPGR